MIGIPPSSTAIPVSNLETQAVAPRPAREVALTSASTAEARASKGTGSSRSRNIERPMLHCLLEGHAVASTSKSHCSALQWPALDSAIYGCHAKTETSERRHRQVTASRPSRIPPFRAISNLGHFLTTSPVCHHRLAAD